MGNAMVDILSLLKILHLSKTNMASAAGTVEGKSCSKVQQRNFLMDMDMDITCYGACPRPGFPTTRPCLPLAVGVPCPGCHSSALRFPSCLGNGEKNNYWQPNHSCPSSSRFGKAAPRTLYTGSIPTLICTTATHKGCIMATPNLK